MMARYLQISELENLSHDKLMQIIRDIDNSPMVSELENAKVVLELLPDDSIITDVFREPLNIASYYLPAVSVYKRCRDLLRTEVVQTHRSHIVPVDKIRKSGIVSYQHLVRILERHSEVVIEKKSQPQYIVMTLERYKELNPTTTLI